MKRNVFRDFVVYTVTSIRLLLFKGQVRLFLNDMRYFLIWRKYRVSSKNTLDYHSPWLAFSSISFLKKWLNKNMLVYEYGSGGSTIFFSENVAKIISVEHDKNWFSITEKAIAELDLNNIQYNLQEPEAAEGNMRIKNSDINDPDSYCSSFPEYNMFRFQKYAQSIDQYPDNHFDLVVVDGRARQSCIAHSMRKIKVNGILLIDNANRERYLSPFPQLNENEYWDKVEFTGHFPFCPASVLDTTMIYFKKNKNL